jgi:cysteine desulfurase
VRGVPNSLHGYLDAASTEPLHPAARDVLTEAYDAGWADPARLYGSARRARLLLDNAREIVAAAVGARPDEVSFTASGTQAVHLAVLGTAAARDRTGRHLVVSAIEHSSVLHAAASVPSAEVTRVPVDRSGLTPPWHACRQPTMKWAPCSRSARSRGSVPSGASR